MSRPKDLTAAGRVLVLGAFVIVAASLVASVGKVQPSSLPNSIGATIPSVPTVAPTQVAPPAGWGSSDLAFGVLLVVLVAMVLLLVRKKRGGFGGRIFWQTMGGLIGIATYFFIVYFVVRLPQPSLGVTEVQAFSVAVVVFCGIVAAFAVMAYQALREKARALRASSADRDGGPLKTAKELVERLRARLYSDRGGGADRESVIACYSAMTKLLDDHGASDRPSYTPRELRFSAGRSLNITGHDIDELTRLFEKARYGETEVTHADALESVEALDRLTGELETPSR